MAASLFDSAIHRNLFGDAEIGRLFADTAEVRAMLLVEGALARAQGTLGLIPETAAAFIHRASLELQVDPGGLAGGAGQSGVAVPALVRAFREAMQAPEHAQFVHWGATSQDVIDTALVLRLRRVDEILEARLRRLAGRLADLAEAGADQPIAARTYGQIAVPTTVGAVAAGWGAPLLRDLDRLAEMQPRLLCVSLSGAAGTLAAMGPEGPRLRAALAVALGLHDPGGTWHAQRDRIAEFAAWATLVTGSAGKIGADLIELASRGEARFGHSGGSSTMPQKENPVAPSALVALARHVAALNGEIQAGLVHREQRDGAAWFSEWLALPQVCIATGRALDLATETIEALSIDPLPSDPLGLVHAEALSFALARQMPRPQAQRRVAALCAEARAEGRPLPDLAAERHPELDLELPALGVAPAEARAFAAATRKRCT